MDDTDIQLCRLLLMNSRQTYRDLAASLSLSIQAVHRRIQALEQVGAIRRYNVSLSDAFLGAIKCSIRCSSEHRSYNDLVTALGKDERTLFLFYCGINRIYLVALLHEISELEEYLEFLRREVKVTEPQVAFAGVTRFPDKGPRPVPREWPELTPLDYRIILTLMEDSRRPVTELAQDLKISARTVKRRLDRMVSEGLLEFSLDFFPGATPSSTVFMFIELKPSADRRSYMADAVKRYGKYLLFIQPFNDLPQTFVMNLWTPTQMIVNDIEQELSKDASVNAVRTNVIQEGAIFRTWRERLVAERAKAP